jgi:hypothetical protein
MARVEDGREPAGDRLLDEVARAAGELAEARRRVRLLFAFAREVVGPRPYRLRDLAAASGLSVSGVRTAYGPEDVSEVRRIVGSGDPDNRGTG